MRRRFRRDIKRTKSLKGKIGVAGQASLDLEMADWTAGEATEEVAKWLVAASGRVSAEEFGAAAFQLHHHWKNARGVEEAEWLHTVGYFLLCVFSKNLRRGARSQVAALPMGLAILDARSTGVDRDLRLLFLSKYREVGERWANEDHERVAVAKAPAEEAVMIAQLRDPAAVDRAIALYESSLEELAELEAEDVEGAAWYRAKALNNLAQTYRERREGDREENLRCALELFDQCLEHPARREDRGAWLFSLQSRVATTNELSRPVEDEEEVRGLLEPSVAMAEAGLEELREGGDFTPYDRRQLQRNLWLAWANARYELLKAVGPAEEFREHCRSVAERFDEYFGKGGGEFSMVKDRFLLGANASVGGIGWEHGQDVICEMAGRLSTEQRALNPEEAQRLSYILGSLSEWGTADDGSYPQGFPWEALSFVMGRVNPRATTVSMAREMFRTEAAFLEPTVSRDRRPEGLEEYVERGVSACRERLEFPNLSLMHRRAVAARLRLLTVMEQNLASSDECEAKRLCGWDERGAAAYRSDLFFWGQGEVEDAGANGQEMTEDLWRGHLYDARLGIDTAEFVAAMMQLGRYHPDIFPPPEFVRLRYGVDIRVSDSEGVMEAGNVASEKGVEEARRRFDGVLGAREVDWQGPGEGRRQHVEPGELDDWLAHHPKMGVLVSGNGVIELNWGAADGPLRSQEITDGIGEDEWADWAEAARALVDAQNQFELGADVEIPDPDDVVSSERYGTDIDWTEYVNEGGMRAPDDASALALGDALARCFEAGSPLAEKLVALAEREGLARLAVLSRDRTDLVPWEHMKVRGDRLGEVLDMVRLPTLADAAPKERPRREETFTCVPLKETRDSTTLGARSLGAVTGSGGVRGTMARDEFDECAMQADVLRLFTHSRFDFSPSGSAFALGDEAAVEAPDMTSLDIDFKDTNVGAGWYTAGEVKRIELRGCRRVELWGCESHLSLDTLGAFFGEDEPTGLAYAFLSAGAQRVVGAWWKQPVAPAALIAAAFAERVPDDADAWDDAAALTAALRAYRAALAEGGPMESAVLEYVREKAAEAEDPERLRRSALAAGWCAALESMTGEAVEGPENVDLGSYLGGFLNETVEEGELREIRENPGSTVRDWLELWRAPTAWAGWRVTARDRSCLDRNEDSTRSEE